MTGPTERCKTCEHQFRYHDPTEEGYFCRIVGCKCRRRFWR